MGIWLLRLMLGIMVLLPALLAGFCLWILLTGRRQQYDSFRPIGTLILALGVLGFVLAKFHW